MIQNSANISIQEVFPAPWVSFLLFAMYLGSSGVVGNSHIVLFAFFLPASEGGGANKGRCCVQAVKAALGCCGATRVDLVEHLPANMGSRTSEP